MFSLSHEWLPTYPHEESGHVVVRVGFKSVYLDILKEFGKGLFRLNHEGQESAVPARVLAAN